ncbi:transcription factor RFX4-like isoform X1 [Dermacentor andersoni]|uniref:transcription factor RFX4-like isoform X1 n=1 Tax=Dermacentor andersoni TaxID=34620 RepID=UPI00241611AB|nr:transcription factor RFX4-like isoform X1 [Dermacentor andersoni]
MQDDSRPVKSEWGWLRPHSTPATLLWLQQNYEVAEGVCIPRNTLYLHYVDFCARNAMQPVNAASFGKIIRQQFPQLTTRRLGTRGQSRYHYYGIAVRVGSLYFEPPYGKGAGHRRPQPQQGPPPASRLVLPEFPRVRELLLPVGADAEQLAGFVAMYRGHCQRLLDECTQPHEPPLAGVLQCVAHFWRRVPAHLASLLASNALANLVGVCDGLLYGAVADALLPTYAPPPHDSVRQCGTADTSLASWCSNACRAARLLSEQLEPWLDAALAGFPAPLRAIKLHMCRRLSQALRRRLSLAKLWPAWRAAVPSHDWALLDLTAVSAEAVARSPRPGTPSARFVYARAHELCALLGSDEQALSGWLEALVERSVASAASATCAAAGPLARHFLAVWCAAGAEAERQMPALRPLRTLLDEWARALLERLLGDALLRQLLDNVASDAPPDACCIDGLLLEPAVHT